MCLCEWRDDGPRVGIKTGLGEKEVVRVGWLERWGRWSQKTRLQRPQRNVELKLTLIRQREASFDSVKVVEPKQVLMKRPPGRTHPSATVGQHQVTSYGSEVFRYFITPALFVNKNFFQKSLILLIIINWLLGVDFHPRKTLQH